MEAIFLTELQSSESTIFQSNRFNVKSENLQFSTFMTENDEKSGNRSSSNGSTSSNNYRIFKNRVWLNVVKLQDCNFPEQCLPMECFEVSGQTCKSLNLTNNLWKNEKSGHKSTSNGSIMSKNGWNLKTEYQWKVQD